jgi:HSP20 family protein
MMQKWRSPFSSMLESLEDFNWPLNVPANWTQGNQGLNLFEDEDSVTIEAALPGLSEEDIEVTREKDALIVRGEKKEAEEDKKRKYYRRMSSSFMYHVALPNNIDDTQEPQAEFKDGICKITFKKQKKQEPKKIKVQKRS